MIELKNINYTVSGADGKRNAILKDINLTFPDHAVTVITGHNGSGKSTLIKLLAGIEKPTGGRIYYNNADITDESITARANLGFTTAFQQPVRFKGITVRRLLDIASGQKNSLGDLCDKLSVVGLCARDYIDREMSDSLSGGELKRVELAMALAKGGEVFLLDEPEAGIDLWSFDSLTGLFKGLKGKTVVIVSHQSKIIEIADYVVLLDKAAKPLFGSREEMLPHISSNANVCSVMKEADNG